MANNWLTQELPGLNPDWFSHIKLFSIKHACRFFYELERHLLFSTWMGKCLVSGKI